MWSLPCQQTVIIEQNYKIVENQNLLIERISNVESSQTAQIVFSNLHSGKKSSIDKHDSEPKEADEALLRGGAVGMYITSRWIEVSYNFSKTSSLRELLSTLTCTQAFGPR